MPSTRTLLKSAIGIAALNAFTQCIFESRDEEKYDIVKKKDGFDLLKIQSNKTVTLIGAFGPYLRRLRMTGNSLYIIEKHPQALRSDGMKHYRSKSEMSLKNSD